MVRAGSLCKHSHNPLALLVAVLLIAVIFIVAVYWVMYGALLWAAGIVCGCVLGIHLHEAPRRARLATTHPATPDGTN